MADNKDAHIRAQFALKLAAQFFEADDFKTKAEEDYATFLTNIKDLAKEFYNMVDEVIEAGNKVEEAPASEASIKYLKSLLMQNGRGQLNGKNIDSFIKHHAGELTQNNVSGLIDEIKTNPKTVSEWLDDVSDRSERDYDPPEKRDEGKEPAKSEPLVDDKGKELPY